MHLSEIMRHCCVNSRIGIGQPTKKLRAFFNSLNSRRATLLPAQHKVADFCAHKKITDKDSATINRAAHRQTQPQVF